MFNKKNIPNTITLINMFLGCLAVVLALEGSMAIAALIILGCSLLDFLDGFFARILQAGSPLGQQLDSLADLISFGMAPAAMAFAYLRDAMQTGPQAGVLTLILPYLAFSLAVFSGLRLAKFNIDTRQREYFIGLPTPANALFFASFPFVQAYAPQEGIISGVIDGITANPWMMLGLVGVFSWLLVSHFSMFSMKFSNLNIRANAIRYAFIAGAVLLLLAFGLQAPPVIMVFYLILSLFFHFNIPPTHDEVPRRN